MKIAAVILAGGEGSRMGGGKPLRVLAGKTLIDRALAQAHGYSELVAIAVRDEGQVGNVEARIARDEPGIEGPLAGLVAALRFASQEGAEAVLTLPADMPFLPANLAARLATALTGNRAAIASSGGHLHPVCGLWRLDALGFVRDYLASGRRSLKGFAEVIGFAAVDWSAEPRDPFFNINSAADLQEAEQMLSD